MKDKPSLLDELKRRNVVRMAGFNLVGAWLLSQVEDTVLLMFGAPDAAQHRDPARDRISSRTDFSWVFELTPEGLKRDEKVLDEESHSE